MVVKTTQQDIYRQTQSQFALRHQPGRQGGNRYTLGPVRTVMGILGSPRFFADQFGRKVNKFATAQSIRRRQAKKVSGMGAAFYADGLGLG